jgi:hypothetical protein
MFFISGFPLPFTLHNRFKTPGFLSSVDDRPGASDGCKFSRCPPGNSRLTSVMYISCDV